MDFIVISLYNTYTLEQKGFLQCRRASHNTDTNMGQIHNKQDRTSEQYFSTLDSTLSRNLNTKAIQVAAGWRKE